MTDNLTIKIDGKLIYDEIMELKGLSKEMIKHQKETNGRVLKLEGKCDKDIVPRIDKLEKVHIKQAAFIAGVVAVIQVIVNYI